MFKLPITYNKHMKLAPHITNDLELVKLNEGTEFDHNSLYGILFNPTNTMMQNALVKMASVYSYDKKYLKETQAILKKYKTRKHSVNLNSVLNEWTEIKNMKNFKDIYNYCSWNTFEFLNNNDISLQFMTVYTLLSPVLSLVVPIIGMIIPFILINLRGMRVTFTDYFNILKEVMKNHTLGRSFMSFQGADANKKVYIIVSIFFYFF